MKFAVAAAHCLFLVLCGALTAVGAPQPNEWLEEPSLSKTVWIHLKDEPATISLGRAAHGTVVCSHSNEQLAALGPGYYSVTFTVAADDEYEGLFKRLYFTVERSRAIACELSSDRRTLTATFDPVDEDRELVMCGGDVDAGSDLSGWKVVRPLATVPAGTSSLTCALPGFGSAFEVARVYLRYRTEMLNPVLGYASPECLLAQWDGESNAGYGVHDATRTSPVELTGNITDQALKDGKIPAEDKCFVFGSGYLAFSSVAIKDAINRGAITVELVLSGSDTSPVRNGGIVGFGNAGDGTGRGLWLYHSDGSHMFGDMSYHAKSGGETCSLYVGAQSETNTYSFNLGATTGQSALYMNGTRTKDITRYGTDMTSANCYLGKIGTYGKANARVYSIRVYGKQLSEDEMARNRALDKCRFSGEPEPPVMSQPFFACESLVIRKVLMDEAKIPAILRVAFPVAENGDGRLFAVWGRKDKGDDLADWGESCVYLGAIPPGAAGMDFEIPESARATMDERTGFRVLIKAKLSAGDYVATTNLLAQWDGLENAGYGIHDSTRAYPLELTGSVVNPALVGTIPAHDDYFTFGSGMLSFHLPKLVPAINEGHGTVELALTSRGDTKQNGGYFCFGDRSRGIWFYQGPNDGFIGAISYHSANEIKKYSITRNKDDFDTWAIAMGTNTASSALLCSGEKVNGDLTRFSTTLAETDDICHLGALPWNGVNNFSIANVHSVRVYDRRLTADEIVENAKIDKHRFREDYIFRADQVSPFKKANSGLVLIVQ